MRTSFLAPLAVLTLVACVINTSDDDDDGNDTGDISSSQSASTTATTTAGTSDGSTSVATDASSSESTAATSVADSSTGAAGSCGWGATNDPNTPSGYVCGGDGEDPDGMFTLACPASVELVVDGDCGGNMGITGAGCCDADGNVWFCADDTGTMRLFTEDC